MATSKLALLLTISALVFNVITSTELPDSVVDAEVHNDVVSEARVSDTALRVELDQLKSKISLLESKVDESAREITSKEKTVNQLEKIVQEKSNSLASLQSQIQLLKEKESLNAKEQEVKAHARSSELQEQINNLKKDIEAQNEKKTALESRANRAEKKIQDLKTKLEELQRTYDEQNSRIRKTQRALEVAEEELVKAKMEASSLSRQLMEVREGWIPPWLAVHLVHCQSFVMTNWNKHGRPALDLTMTKAMEKKSELENWAKPHVDTFKSKWVPLIKEHGLAFANDLGLHVRSLTSKAMDIYHESKKSVEPHIVRLQEITDPYFQEAKKFVKSYVNQVSSSSKPHIDKARVFLKPYTKKVTRNYKKLVKKANVYHRQGQSTILDVLKSNEFTRPFATKELAWYMASALMALPVFFVLNMVSAVFRKKPKERARASHSGHARRRTKRGNLER